MSATRRFTIPIKGCSWLIQLWTHKQYEKKFGKDSRAITFLDDKIINFDKEYLSVGVIRHELLHAMAAEAHIESANLNAEQIEEVCASIIQYQCSNILALTDAIIDEFLKGKEIKEGE